MRVLWYCLFCLIIDPTFGQDPVQDLIEEAGLLFDQKTDYQILTEELLELAQNPIDLSKAGRKDLEQLFILSNDQITSILQYVEKKNILSIYELQTLPGIDLKTLRLVLPFLNLSVKENKLKKGKRPAHYLILRYDQNIQLKKGFRTIDSIPSYRGGPGHWVLRYRLNYPRQLSIGLNLEKDPGESFHWNASKGYYGIGHINFHLQYHWKKIRFILGDYRLQFGQALLIGGAGFQLGKSAAPILGIKRNGLGIKPHNSLTEYGYFKGVAFSYTKGFFKLTPFYSFRRRDSGTFLQDGKEYFNLRNTGLHRTSSEFRGLNRVGEFIYGMNMDFSIHDNLSAGINFIQTRFSKTVSKTPSLYDQFKFRGRSQSGISSYFDLSRKNFNLFSEFAYDLRHRSIAMVAGLLINLSHKLEMAIHLRNFPKDFHSFYGNAFSEKSGQHNENGVYLALQCKILQRSKLSIYADQYRYPWLRSGHSSPSYGWEYGLAFDTKIRKTVLAMRYSMTTQLGDSQIHGFLRQQALETSHRFRFKIEKNVSKALGFKWHIMGSRYESEKRVSGGILIAQDMSYKSARTSLKCRLSLFDTQDHNSRQYIYENDVLYGFSIPSFSGTGIRYFALIQFRFNHHFTSWIRWSATHYRDRFRIGSGNEEVDGNKQQQVRLQLRYRF